MDSPPLCCFDAGSPALVDGGRWRQPPVLRTLSEEEARKRRTRGRRERYCQAKVTKLKWNKTIDLQGIRKSRHTKKAAFFMPQYFSPLKSLSCLILLNGGEVDSVPCVPWRFFFLVVKGTAWLVARFFQGVSWWCTWHASRGCQDGCASQENGREGERLELARTQLTLWG